MDAIVSDLGRTLGPRPPRLLRVAGTGMRRAFALLALSAPLALVAPAVRAAADPVSNAQNRVNQVTAQLKAAQAQAAAMNSQLQADGARLDELAQQYEVAQQHVADLDAQISATQAQITATEARVEAAQALLRSVALRSYMSGSSDGGVVTLFSSPGVQSMARQEYSRVAGGNVSTAIDGLQVAKESLNAQKSQLQGTEVQAKAAAAQVASAQSSAAAVEASQRQALAGASAQVTALVGQQRQAQQAEAAAQYQAQLAAEAARAAQSGTFVNVAVSQNASGAVQAAESQLGVPYVWGGESPKGSANPGFDCSGLTQWSWRQAGVSLPRTAQEQYDAIPHVSMSSIAPGDLIFWNDGTSSVQHVGMYVGNGDVIDAPQTGQNVQIQPIWFNGLVGAGRP